MALFVHPPITVDTAGLATEAKQDVIIGHIDGLEAALSAIESKLTTTTSRVPLFWNFATVGQNLAAGVWKEIIASVATSARSVSFWNPTGEIIEIGIGAGGAEVSVEFMGPGDGIKNIPIPAGARVSLRCANNVAADTLVLGFLN